MRPETLRRRIEAAEQRHIDNAPRLPNRVCFAEGDETGAQTLARLGINRDDYDTLIVITTADASVPRPEDSP